MNTPSLLLALVVGHGLYLLVPDEAKGPVYAASLGFLLAVLTWTQRGPVGKARWFICVWGAIEGLQMIPCQLAQLWAPVGAGDSLCQAHTGWPVVWWSLWAILIVTYIFWVEEENG